MVITGDNELCLDGQTGYRNNCVLYCSYMDTEQYEEAVRDYEQVYQTEKTKGKY